jgi:Fur family iron response transcriptional regulator
MNEKISLATVYNTVHAFQKKGHLKEIAINSDKTYYDTNTSIHHHFYDEETYELIDCDENDIDPINLKKDIPGKKIKSLEVLIKVASDNQNQN